MLRDVPIIVLCGGLGTRLRDVLPDTPKILAPLGDKTLLDGIFSSLTKAGFTNIILSVGHLKEQIQRYVAKKRYPVRLSVEEKPLGTGGAVARALRLVRAPRFCALNGDMFFQPNWEELLRFHARAKSIASLFMTRWYAGNGGHVLMMGKEGRITAWREKNNEDKPDKIYINAGAYCMEAVIARAFPSTDTFSLERDVFPALIPDQLAGLKTKAPLIDIGTPERYAFAKRARLW